ncbi:DUF3375 domain-containing protein [Cytophagaceae bacterium ABcell3]|nr:DUF3375 domain-containing protein [Cytophagaceae bacterium ABcell3]
MKINFAAHDDVKWLLESNKAVTLLKKDTAPLIISFLFFAFKTKNRTAWLSSELIPLLSDFLFNLNEQQEKYTSAPKYYLEQWTKEGFLRQFYDGNADEATFELTPSTENALRWITEFNKSEFVGTESRLMQIFDLLQELVIKTSEDRDKRLEELLKQKKEIEEEIARVQSGEIGVMNSTAVRERTGLLEETSSKLLSDFRQIEENFRLLNTQAREDQIKKQLARGKFLDNVFKARDLIMDSDQGKSFMAFWEFLMNQEKQEELDQMIATVTALKEIKEVKLENLENLKVSLVNAGDRVNKTTDLLTEQLRRFLESASVLENRRIAEVIQKIEESALAVRLNPPSQRNFLEIDHKPGVNLPMEKKPFTPPQVPVISSEVPEEGAGEVNFNVLFSQLYVDPEELKKRIRFLLREKEQVSLGDIVREIPVEKGLTEIVTYFSLATQLEKQNKAIVDSNNKETVYYESDGLMSKIEIPKTIFLK